MTRCFMTEYNYPTSLIISVGSGPLSDITASFAITNAFNQGPPAISDGINSPPTFSDDISFDRMNANANAIGKNIAFQLTKSW